MTVRVEYHGYGLSWPGEKMKEHLLDQTKPSNGLDLEENERIKIKLREFENRFEELGRGGQEEDDASSSP